MSVAVTSNQTTVKLAKRYIHRIVRAVLRGEGIREAEISVAFVDNPTMRRLNRQFLGHDWPTDVLTFPLGDAGDAVLCGEVVISADTARQVARRLGHSARAEAALYLIHGLLHLCGCDDRRAKDRKRMRAREEHYCRTLGIRLN